jgi:hypothetical protein
MYWFILPHFSYVPHPASFRMPREKVTPRVSVKEKVAVKTKTRRGLERLVLRTPSPTLNPISSRQKGQSESPSKRQRLGEYDMQGEGWSPEPEVKRRTKVL